MIKRVVDAYTTLRGAIGNGRLGSPASARRRKAESKPIVFRLDAAHSFDDALSWQLDAGAVSIWTGAWRCKNLEFACSPDQAKMLAAHRKGESDLVHRDGKWFLLVTCEVPELDVYEPADWGRGGPRHRQRGHHLRRRQPPGPVRYLGPTLARKRAELQAKRTTSPVAGAVSLGPPTSSPGSTCATAHAWRGIRQHAPTRPRDSRDAGGCDL